MIDASIPLQFKPNIEAPNLPNMFMQGQNLALQRQAALQEQQLRNQQIQAGTLENQQRQYDLQDQQIMRSQLPQLMSDPANQDANGNPDFTKITPKLSGSGISAKALLNLQQMGLGIQDKIATIKKTQADTSKTDQEVQEAKADLMGRVALNIKNSNYDPTVAEGALTILGHQFPEDKDGADQYRATFAQDPSTIKPITDYLIGQSGKATTELREQTAANITNAKNQAETANATAGLPSITAKATMDTARMKAFQTMTPDQWSARVGDTVPDKTSPLYKRTLSQVMGLVSEGRWDEADTAIKDAGDQLGRTETQVAAVKAEAPTRQAMEEAIQKANIQERFRQEQVSKLVTSQQSVAHVQQLGETLKGQLQAAAAGNATASEAFKANLPAFIAAAEGVHGLQGGQLERSPGSLVDKLQGALSGAVAGKPINTRESKEAPGVIDQLVNGAINVHNSLVDISGKNYGTQFDKLQPVKPAAKTYTQADVDAAVQAHPGLTAAQADAAFKAKGYEKK